MEFVCQPQNRTICKNRLQLCQVYISIIVCFRRGMHVSNVHTSIIIFPFSIKLTKAIPSKFSMSKNKHQLENNAVTFFVGKSQKRFEYPTYSGIVNVDQYQSVGDAQVQRNLLGRILVVTLWAKCVLGRILRFLGMDATN